MKKVIKLTMGRDLSAWGIIWRMFLAVAIVAFAFGAIKIAPEHATNQVEPKNVEAEVKTKAETKAEAPPPKVKAIVVCCSDPRLCMYKKIRERYGLIEEECFPIVVPGGPDSLANPNLMCDECRSVKKYTDIILAHPAPTLKFVFVAEHEDCACIKHYGFTDPHQGKKDFPAIREFFAQKAPKLELVMEYYSFSDREKGLVNPVPEVIKID